MRLTHFVESSHDAGNTAACLKVLLSNIHPKDGFVTVILTLILSLWILFGSFNTAVSTATILYHDWHVDIHLFARIVITVAITAAIVVVAVGRAHSLSSLKFVLAGKILQIFNLRLPRC